MTLNQSALDLLDQINQAIAQLSDEEYKQAIEPLSHASIGQHVRHTLEFFICLFDARNDQVLNYDGRKRDKYIEEEVKFAQRIIQSIKDLLSADIVNESLVLEASYTIQGSETIQIPTTFYRELAYNIEHTIHHMALIKIGIKSSFAHVELSEHFGVATSTVRHYKKQKV